MADKVISGILFMETTNFKVLPPAIEKREHVNIDYLDLQYEKWLFLGQKMFEEPQIRIKTERWLNISI